MTERTSDSRRGDRITGGWEETCLLSLRPPPRPRVWSLGGPRLVAAVTLDLVVRLGLSRRRTDIAREEGEKQWRRGDRAGGGATPCIGYPRYTGQLGNFTYKVHYESRVSWPVGVTPSQVRTILLKGKLPRSMSMSPEAF